MILSCRSVVIGMWIVWGMLSLRSIMLSLWFLLIVIVVVRVVEVVCGFC